MKRRSSFVSPRWWDGVISGAALVVVVEFTAFANWVGVAATLVGSVLLSLAVLRAFERAGIQEEP